MSSADYQSVRGLPLSDCPLKKLVDEYYWVNVLIAVQRNVGVDNFLYCNPDRTRTQACSFDLTAQLLVECRQSRYLFIRKVGIVNVDSASLLKEIYEQPHLSPQWM